jgi:hypothetical protein
MSTDSLAGQMRAAAARLLAALDDGQRQLAARRFTDDAARRWLEYRPLLDQLVALYLDRLPAGLAAREAARLAGQELHFACEGPLTPGARHYYRVQADDLLIEYDTTDEGTHAHTVLRRPRSDFGDDILAAHYAQVHP